MNSPSVQGFRFVWQPWGEPRYFTPEGVEVDFAVASDGPYLPRHFVAAWKQAAAAMPSLNVRTGGGEQSFAAAATREEPASAAGAASSSGAALAEVPQHPPAPAAATDEVDKT